MNTPVAVIGMGEMGSVFARGFLKCGHPVYGVTRTMSLSKMDKEIPAVEIAVLAVGEKDFQATLQAVPKTWRDRLILLQNELLPKDWKAHGIQNPTVISVWFEKKKGQDTKVLIPSPVFGPQASVLQKALGTLDIPVRILKSEEELLVELVTKNLYILTVNIAGLMVGGTVGTLWREHQDLARAVASEVLDIQFYLIGKTLDREALIHKMVEAFEGDWAHKCMGRSAPARLARALQKADEAGLQVPQLQKIHTGQVA